MKNKVSVTRCKDHGKLLWRVRWHDLGRTKRKFFPGRGPADAFAASLRGESLTARQRMAALPDATIQTLLAAHDEAQKRGVNLLSAIAECRPMAVESPAAQDVLDEMTRVKERAGRNADYLSIISYIVGALIKGRERLPMNQITFADVEKFIDGHNLSYRSTLRSRLSTWFKFSVRRGYRADNPCARLEPVKRVRQPPRILTLEEVCAARDWLKVNPRSFAWFVLSTFAGLRPEEAQKTSWSMVNFDEGWIRVEAQTTKVAQRRVVYPLPEAMKWVKFAKRMKAEIPLTEKQLQVERNGLRAALGFEKWPPDVTRHTAASMWLAFTGDAAKIAGQLGHSERILHTNYKALVTKADAEKFWAISPSGSKRKRPALHASGRQSQPDIAGAAQG